MGTGGTALGGYKLRFWREDIGEQWVEAHIELCSIYAWKQSHTQKELCSGDYNNTSGEVRLKR